LGPGPLDPQIRHAQGFSVIAHRASPEGPARLVDLGSGGGLPGLVVATEWPGVTMTLLEANGRRAAFLRRAVERLGLEHRVSVLEERAEDGGREPGLRASFDGAMARSFGRPAVVAECAAPLLRLGGWLLVSEPPRSDEDEGQDGRWPAEPLGQLGLAPDEVVHEGFEYRLLCQVGACPERFPRRNGVPAKKPLF
ncbi:MAG TPA: RsmG family class I SAM-dependent methyltransferase, partial [Acidimicrobiales bacterium]|nr:RsmG family class I SAM-dependent methyltransferase [Acidimicrobiales bacterium]